MKKHDGELANPGMLTGRVGEKLMDDVRAEVARRRTPDGKPMSVTDAAKDALAAWLQQMKLGALYPTPRERSLIDGLRALTPTYPDAVEGVFLLAESVLRDPTSADALARLIPLIRAFAPQPLETQPPDEAPSQNYPKVTKRKSGRG